MKLQHAEYFNEVSPNDIIDTMELDLNSEEKRIFSDAILLAQQYDKYIKDYKSGNKTIMTNRDNITWYRRFIYDALLRKELVDKLENPLLKKVQQVVLNMKDIELKFIEECLQIDKLYEKTIQDISNHPIKEFKDLGLFIGECSEAKKKHIQEKIDNIPEKLSKLIMFH
ncbi:MAG TPA: hypothetical protein PK718_02735 [Candidatus Methanofastidiosa archaeon]|nr:hypothetical protein [Candidatus Methanofastidiosa archaeon]